MNFKQIKRKLTEATAYLDLFFFKQKIKEPKQTLVFYVDKEEKEFRRNNNLREYRYYWYSVLIELKVDRETAVWLINRNENFNRRLHSTRSYRIPEYYTLVLLRHLLLKGYNLELELAIRNIESMLELHYPLSPDNIEEYLGFHLKKFSPCAVKNQ